MTYNIWDLNGKRLAVEDVVKVIRSEGVPDLILLQEVRGESMASKISEALGLSHHVYHEFKGKTYGAAIISRVPLTDTGFLLFKAGGTGRGALMAHIVVNGRKVRVCSAHLDRIESVKVEKEGVEISWGGALSMLAREITEETVRSRSVDELMEWVGSGNPGGRMSDVGHLTSEKGRIMASILIVDDEWTTRLELDEMLTSAGYQVAGKAETGQQAVEMAAELVPDLILMDIVMPGDMDGISAAEIIKADSNIPIIFLSGYGDPEFVERAKRVEPFGYVMKPFDEAEVRAFVEIALYKSKIEKELEAAHRKLERLHKEWEGIFQAIGNPTVLLDAQRRVIHANATTLKRTGLSAEEIIGMKCHDVFHRTAQPPKDCPYEKVITTGSFETCEMTLDALDGTFLLSFTPLFDSEGRVEKVIHIATDITERKRIEAEKKSLETALRQTRKMEMIGTLTGGIAHDYNNLLAITMGNISLAKTEVKPGAPILAYLKNAENAALKTKDLTHKLMALSEGGAPMRESGSIGSLLREVLEEMTPPENIECSLEISRDLWNVHYDPTQMRYAISNVLINAMEALPRGGVIDIQAGNTIPGDPHNAFPITSENGKHVLISVKDNGTGIPEEHLEKIFDPYFSTKDRGIQKGMGLGLTTSDMIIRKHEGSMKVESVPSAGTTVSIYLPAAESEAFEEKKVEKEVVDGCVNS